MSYVRESCDIFNIYLFIYNSISVLLYFPYSFVTVSVVQSAFNFWVEFYQKEIYKTM